MAEGTHALMTCLYGKETWSLAILDMLPCQRKPAWKARRLSDPCGVWRGAGRTHEKLSQYEKRACILSVWGEK